MASLALTILLAPGCALVLGEPGAYLELADRYREENTEAAIHGFDEMDRGEMEAALVHIERGERTLRRDVCLRIVALLHTEAGIRKLRDARWSDASFHFDAAWRLSNRIASPAAKSAFQRDWLLAAALAHQDTVFTVGAADRGFTEAARFFSDARSRYPRDVELLVAQGALLEWAGSLRWGDRDRLKGASSLYRRALGIEPENAEALVRYGWTLKKLGRDGEAEEALSRALPLPAQDNLIYRSRMGLGALAENAGEYDEAIAQYEEAGRSGPSHPSAKAGTSSTSG